MACFAMMPARVACICSILAADMFLPAKFNIDLPLIPPVDKDIIASLSALVACLIFRPKLLTQKAPGSRYNWLFALLIAGSLLTVLTNGDPLQYGPTWLVGETLHDFLSDAILLLLTWWTPFFLGRKLFNRIEDVRILLSALVIGGLIYSFFIFIEIRLSPQLNMWVYGYHQSDFIQTIRFGSYRPKVFMRHGLNVALFILVAVLAAGALKRAKLRLGMGMGFLGVAWAGGYLTMVLILCRSSGALVYGLILLPMLLWARSRLQSNVIMTVSIALFAYPLLRSYGLVPVEKIAEFFSSLLGADRAQSLSFRFENETLLLNRAVERMWFGWGGYARSFPHDGATGQRIAVVDGTWIGVLGASGLVGFISTFGLLLLPILLTAWRLRAFVGKQRFVAVGVLVLGLVYVIDLIPNSGVGPYLNLIIGCLAGLQPDPPAEADAVSFQIPNGDANSAA